MGFFDKIIDNVSGTTLSNIKMGEPRKLGSDVMLCGLNKKGVLFPR